MITKYFRVKTRPKCEYNLLHYRNDINIRYLLGKHNQTDRASLSVFTKCLQRDSCEYLLLTRILYAKTQPSRIFSSGSAVIEGSSGTASRCERDWLRLTYSFLVFRSCFITFHTNVDSKDSR